MAEDAIISFTIKIHAELDEDAKSTLSNLQEAKDKQSTGNNDTTEDDSQKSNQQTKNNAGKPNDVFSSGNLGNFKKDPFFSDLAEEQARQDQLKKDVVDTLNKLDSKGLQTLSSFATNPTNASLNAISQVLSFAGPEGQALLAIVALAVATPEVIKTIVQALSTKGAPWNRDYQIQIDKQVDVGLSRLLQKRTEQGIDQVILGQGKKGYVPNNSAWTYNSYFKLDETRLARIGLTDRSAGVVTI